MMYKDKIDHFMYWFFITKVLMVFLPLPLACLISFVIGVLKEAWDYISEKGTCDWKDLVADACGIAAACII